MRTLVTVAAGGLYLLGLWTALSSFSTQAAPAPPPSRTEATVEVTLAVIGEPSLDLHCRTALIRTAALDVLVLSSPRAQAAEYAAMACNDFPE